MSTYFIYADSPSPDLVHATRDTGAHNFHDLLDNVTLSVGDIVEVVEGSIIDDSVSGISFTIAGTPGLLTIRSYNRNVGKPIIKLWPGNTDVSFYVDCSSGELVVSNINFISDVSGYSILRTEHADSVSYTGCSFKNVVADISIASAGILIGVKNCKFIGTNISDNYSNLRINSDTGSCTISNNNFYKGTYGIALSGSYSNLQVINNIFSSQSNLCIYSNSVFVSNLIDYNNTFSWGVNEYHSDGDVFTFGVNNISAADPKFIDPDIDDFYLQSDSPCVGTGLYDGGVYVDSTDCDGMQRNNPTSIGSYEFSKKFYVNINTSYVGAGHFGSTSSQFTYGEMISKAEVITSGLLFALQGSRFIFGGDHYINVNSNNIDSQNSHIPWRLNTDAADPIVFTGELHNGVLHINQIGSDINIFNIYDMYVETTVYSNSLNFNQVTNIERSFVSCDNNILFDVSVSNLSVDASIIKSLELTIQTQACTFTGTLCTVPWDDIVVSSGSKIDGGGNTFNWNSELYAYPSWDNTNLNSFNIGSLDYGVGSIDSWAYNSVVFAPIASFDYVVDPITNVVHFFDTSTNNPTSWLWDFGDWSPESTEQNPVYTYSVSNNYVVTLTVSNPLGSDLISQIVSVHSQGGSSSYPTSQILIIYVDLEQMTTGYSGDFPERPMGYNDFISALLSGNYIRTIFKLKGIITVFGDLLLDNFHVLEQWIPGVPWRIRADNIVVGPSKYVKGGVLNSNNIFVYHNETIFLSSHIIANTFKAAGNISSEEIGFVLGCTVVINELNFPLAHSKLELFNSVLRVNLVTVEGTSQDRAIYLRSSVTNLNTLDFSTVFINSSDNDTSQFGWNISNVLFPPWDSSSEEDYDFPGIYIGASGDPYTLYEQGLFGSERVDIGASGAKNTNLDNLKISPELSLVDFTADKIVGQYPLMVSFIPSINSYKEVLKYTWDFGDGIKSNEQLPKHTYSEGGEFRVILDVSFKNSVSYKKVKNNFIKVFKVVVVSSENGKASPFTVKFSAISSLPKGVLISSYDWDFGDGTGHSTESNPVHTFVGAKKYLINLKNTFRS